MNPDIEGVAQAGFPESPFPHFSVCPVTITCASYLNSTIRHFDGTVSVIPVGEAKTYVNGKHISEPTVLHHVSWLVLK